MPTSTAKWALPYPVAADPADVPTDMGALAARIEAVGPYAWATTGGAFQAPSTVYANNGGANQVIVGFAAGNLAAGFSFGSGTGDTNLYRQAASALKTDGYFRAGANVVGAHGTSAEIGMGGVGPSGASGIYFGSAADTNLYRSAANELKTDGMMRIAAAGAGRAQGTVSFPADNSGRTYTPTKSTIWETGGLNLFPGTNLQLTFTQAGYYLVQVYASNFSVGSGNVAGMWVVLNDATVQSYIGASGYVGKEAGGSGELSGTGFFQANAGDTLKLWGFCAGGGTAVCGFTAWRLPI